jgi:hypothetical protein
MLNADSSTLNSDSDVQSTKAPPKMPSAAALSWIVETTATMLLTELPGKILLSSSTRTLDSSARSVSPSNASARNRSGTKESSAK